MADNFVTISPSELTFKFELRKSIPVTINLTNMTSDRVAFKVKTTSPKKYCVRPSSGVIEPRSAKEVQVIMQPQREAPVSFADCRDKFLVQTVKVDASVTEVTSEMFDIGKAREIRQTKLRVVLVAPPKPPSPVPEGNESEPTSPPVPRLRTAAARTPETAGVADVVNARAEELRTVNDRLDNLTKQATVHRPAAKETSASRAGAYGLLSLLLVALLAFLIGQVSQNALPTIVQNLLEKFEELKSQVAAKFA